ncbi:hypothetical protein VIGAN_01260900 [Vigna angularis var. angularis]|uniref:Secreted protein n=1 Tax=Vigna angularis var. angularis TaxID=157739 RepID=A0A0S3R2C5_PHAAN|nr:hypothetical protein VIGAN_01260900 [Vigna angularis var. angularis]
MTIRSGLAFAVWWCLFSDSFVTTELVIECFDLGLCRNSSSFPQIPLGSKIRVLQMGKGEKHSAFLFLRRCGEDRGAQLSAMDDSLRSSQLKLMVVLARKKRTRPH